MLLSPESEDVPKVVELTTPDETYAVFAGVAFKPVVDILLVEHLQVLGAVLVQTIFHRHVVEERLLLPHSSIVARGYHSANLHTESIVEEPFSELE